MLSGQAVLDLSKPGPADEDVKHWRKWVEVHSRIGVNVEEEVCKELFETGTWSADELEDVDQNWSRIVWVAAGNVNDEESRMIVDYEEA